MNVMDYLGKAWANGACGPDSYDCWGLVRAIYKNEKNVDIPIVNVDALKPLAVRHAFESSSEYKNWREVKDYQNFDVLLLSQATRTHHVGVWFNDKLLHSVEGSGVIWQSLQSLKTHGWKIISAYRRY